MIQLSELKAGSRTRISGVSGEGAIHQRLLEMGVVKGKEIEVVRFAPLGDPMEVIVCGYHLLLRKAEAAFVQVEGRSEFLAETGQ